MKTIERANTARIILKNYGYLQKEVAEKLGISLTSMNRKLKGHVEFTPDEWNSIIKLRNKFKEVKHEN